MKSFCGSAILTFATFVLLPAAVLCQISSASLSKFPDVLKLSSKFDPIIAAYWTGLPHHRRTPFSVSPDGKSAYLAYLDTTYNSVFVQQVDTTTFAAAGDAVEITGAREAGGLVAQNDGFALLATFFPTGTTDIPPNGYPVAEIVRYKDGKQAWITPVNGPGVHAADGLSASPDMNGDLVYSETAGLYAAYFVVTAYTGDASGHFGDSIQYVDDSGELKTITGASSTWGCSHNTGIGLEAADAAPFASVCAEDQGAIWLNTDTQSMYGVKISNENTTNGVSGEPMGGMGGSYSNLASFPGSSQYIFAWQSRGALNLKENAWMGDGFTTCDPRWLNHNVAITLTKDKSTLAGSQAISEVGAATGDAQINWITESDTTDHQNVHVATFDSGNALVTWEELTNPDCQPVPLSCTGKFSGTFFQQVNSDGEKVGDAISATDVYVSGDMATIGDKICWPYVNMVWDLSAPKANGTYVSSMSFACVSLSGSSSGSSSASSTPVSTAASAPTSVAAQDDTTTAEASPTSTRTFENIATTDAETTSRAAATTTLVATTSRSTPTTSVSIGSSAELPTRSFVNIATDVETIGTMTTATASMEDEASTVVSTTEVATATSDAATTSVDTVTEVSTRSFDNIATATDVATPTGTATTPVDTPVESSTRSFDNIATATDIVTPTDVATEAPTSTAAETVTLTSAPEITATETATRTFTNIVTLSTTVELPTVTATDSAPNPTSSAGAGAGVWESCGETGCASGLRCVSFRGGISLCVPTKRSGHGNHN